MNQGSAKQSFIWVSVMLFVIAIALSVSGAIVNSRVTFSKDGIAIAERPGLDIAEGAVGGVEIVPVVSSDKVAYSFHLQDGCSDQQVLKYTTATPVWGCGNDLSGAGGSAIILDLLDDAADESVDMIEIAITGDTNNIITEPSADKVLIAMANNWPSADTADALSANGANCGAGNFPLGVDAAGAVEGCTASGAGSAITFDIGDDGGDDSIDLGEIATTGDTNSVFTESAADKMLIALGNNWPSSDTADALSANGGNCAANQYPLGVDAAGAVESCTADDDTPESGDFGAAVDLETTGAVSANAVALATDTTGNFVATVADAGSSTIAVVGSGSENAAVTLDAVDLNCTNCIGTTEIVDSYVQNTGDTISGGVLFISTSSGIRIADGSGNSPILTFASPTETWDIFANDTNDSLDFDISKAADVDIKIRNLNGGGTINLRVLGDIEIDDENTLEFHENDSNGSNFIAIVAPAAVTSNITCTLEDDATPFDSCVTGGGGSGDIEAVGDCLTASCFVDGTDAGTTLIIEGSTVDTIESRLTFPTDPGVDAVLTIPDDQIADDDLFLGSGAGTFTYTALGDCDDSGGNHLNYDTTTNAFSCGTTTSGGGAAIILQEAEATVDAATATLDFGPGFDLTSSPSTEVNVVLDYTEDPIILTGAEVTGTLDVSDHLNLAVSGTLLNLTGDTLSLNEGTLTDEGLCMYEVTGTQIECTVTTKALLEAQLSDVANIAEADGDTFTGVHDFGGATSIEIVNGTGSTVNADGEIAHDTTADQLIFGAGADVLDTRRSISFTVESPVDADNILLGKLQWGITITDVHCIVDPADSAESVVIDIEERGATGDSPVSFDATITCDNDGAEDDGAISNATFDAGDWASLDIGTVTGTVTQISGVVYFDIIRE